jgi:hypothetical protein
MHDVRNPASVGGSRLPARLHRQNSLVEAVIAFQIEALVEFHTQPEFAGMNSFEALTLCRGVAQDISLLGQQAGAGIGEQDAPLAAVKQAHTELVPELSNLRADCRWATGT